MFETAIGDGSEQFAFEQEISEARGMDADIAAFAFFCRFTPANGQVALLRGSVSRAGGSRSFGGLKLLVGVVDEILFGRHG